MLVIVYNARTVILSTLTPEVPRFAPPLLITMYTLLSSSNSKEPSPLPTLQERLVNGPSKASLPHPSHVFSPKRIPPSV